METLVASLSPIEKKVVPHLAAKKTVSDIARDAGVQEVEAMRACQFLANKKVLEIGSTVVDVFSLTPVGEDVRANGLPEVRFLNALSQPKNLGQIAKDANLAKDELNASIGILKKAGAIQLGKEVTKLQDVSFEDKKKEIETVHEGNATTVSQELITRGLVEKTTRTTYHVMLTPVGKELLTADLSKEYTEKLTPEMLKNGTWKDHDFRRYDVTSPVPGTQYGRPHFVQDAISAIKQIWIEMGFTEMKGTMAQTAFWDLDALYVPQDHPAREMQDTFYLKDSGELPDFWKEVKAAHENGGDTGSTGWQYEYSEEEAKKVLLRTHTTVVSAQMLKQLKPEDLPAKFFSVAKVFRNETLDWKHLFEFHQVEGIVVGEGLSLGDLIGLQKEFYKKMGFTDVRFRPAYFPYTEPSAEVEVFHPGKQQWLELGGMGVFRPEVVKTLLGIDVPVLAWGLGMERIITDYYKINDLRQLYDNDLKRLAEVKQYVGENHANN